MSVTTPVNHLDDCVGFRPVRELALFAEGERDFFLKLVDAQITFVTDSHGRATEGKSFIKAARTNHAKRIE